MSDQNTTQQTTPETSIGGMSLADYRASRENAGRDSHAEAVPVAETKETTPVAGDEDAGDNDAEEGAANDSSEHTEGEKQQKPANKRGGFQRKIDRLTEENRRLSEQLASRNDAAKPEAAEKSEGKKPEARTDATVTPAAFDKPKPRLEDFESLETFAEALSDWKADEREWKQEAKRREESARTEHQKTIERWNQRQAEARKEHADYDEVLESAGDVKLSPAHQRILLESESGAAIAYELAKDPKELKRFAALDPLAAARFLGKLEATYSSDESSESKETPVSRAPKPIRPIGSRASSAATFDVSKASLSDYRRMRESGKLR